MFFQKTNQRFQNLYIEGTVFSDQDDVAKRPHSPDLQVHLQMMKFQLTLVALSILCVTAAPVPSEPIGEAISDLTNSILNSVGNTISSVNRAIVHNGHGVAWDGHAGRHGKDRAIKKFKDDEIFYPRDVAQSQPTLGSTFVGSDAILKTPADLISNILSNPGGTFVGFLGP